MIAREEKSPVGSIVTFPVVDAPVSNLDGWVRKGMGPDLLSIRGVYSHDRIVFRQNEGDVIDDERREEIPVVVARRERPRGLELVYVGRIDLLEARVLCRIRASGKVAPGRVVSCDVLLLLVAPGECDAESRGAGNQEG